MCWSAAAAGAPARRWWRERACLCDWVLEMLLAEERETRKSRGGHNVSKRKSCTTCFWAERVFGRTCEHGQFGEMGSLFFLTAAEMGSASVMATSFATAPVVLLFSVVALAVVVAVGFSIAGTVGADIGVGVGWATACWA